jgi:hypothetical protein
MSKHIMQHQDVDHAAYKKGFSTEDHLLTVSLMIKKSWKYNFPVWLALVDFEKTFGTVENEALWKVLEVQSVTSHYIKLLSALYTGQLAAVQARERSRDFDIGRGVKQGDPISAFLFIAIMQDLCGKLGTKWATANERRKGVKFGIDLHPASGGGCLTNSRFADDVILVAQTKGDIRKMLNDFADRASHYGLKINFSKTKVLTWDCIASGCESLRVGASSVQVPREDESERYLGRKLTFKDHYEVELANRTAAAWAAWNFVTDTTGLHTESGCSKLS